MLPVVHLCSWTLLSPPPWRQPQSLPEAGVFDTEGSWQLMCRACNSAVYPTVSNPHRMQFALRVSTEKACSDQCMQMQEIIFYMQYITLLILLLM